MRIHHTTAALASWEDAQLPAWKRLRRAVRQRAWGPAGSVAFHVAVLGAIVFLAFHPAPVREVQGTVDFDLGPAAQSVSETIETRVPPPPETPPPETPPPEAGVASAIAGSLGSERTTTGESGAGPGSPSSNPLIESLPGEAPPLSTAPGRLIIRIPSGGGMGDRTREGVGRALNEWNGPAGGGRVDDAILRALRWLQKNQTEDGSWNGSAKPAMTGFALLALLGHGELPDQGEFGATVRKAVEWLIANQEDNGLFKGRDGNDYSQPIAAYALCEAAALTGNPKAMRAAERAMLPIVAGQHANGGFNYNLDTANRDDTSYMAWCVQAVKAAKMAKLDVPGLEKACKLAIAGLRLNASPDGGFGYTSPGRTGLSGAGALCLQLLGAARLPEVKKTIAFLTPATFSFERWNQQPYAGQSPLYYWYYVTQAKFQDSRETYLPWNKQFTSELMARQTIEKQALKAADGKALDVGYWTSPSKGEHTGGVVQDTCLCTLMLEVPIRYLPSYRQTEALPEDVVKATVEKDLDIRIR